LLDDASHALWPNPRLPQPHRSSPRRAASARHAV